MNLENIPCDIIDIIFGFLTNKRILPLHFVSKKLNEYTKDRIKETRKFYYEFTNQTAEDKKFDLFKWTIEIKCPMDCDTIRIAINQKEFEIFKYALDNGCRIDEYMLGLVARNGSVELMEWLKTNNFLPPLEDRWNPFSYGVQNEKFACELATENEDINIIKWLRKENYKWHYKTANRAAKLGKIEMLTWMIDNGCDIDPTIYACVREDDPNTLEFLYEKKIMWNADTCAHAAANKKYVILKWMLSNGCPMDARTCLRIADNGDLEMLKYVKAHNCPWHVQTCECAAMHGHLHIIKWARENGCPWGPFTCENAARNGHHKTIKWAINNGCECPENICQFAASGNNLELLQWLVKREYKVNAQVYTIAVWQNNLKMLMFLKSISCEREHTACDSSGNLELLKFLRDDGCGWSAKTCENAAERQDIGLLKWCRVNGCPWDKKVCIVAARNGDLETLKWALKNNCEYDVKVCAIAALEGHLKIVRYLHENGYGWDEKTCSYAAKNNHLSLLQWVIEHGCPYNYKMLQEALLWDLKTITWVIKKYFDMGIIFFTPKKKYLELSTWGRKNDYIFSEWVQGEAQIFYRYIPSGYYYATKKLVYQSKDIVRIKKFILEKAREELEALEKEINETGNVDEIKEIADSYFNYESSSESSEN